MVSRNFKQLETQKNLEQIVERAKVLMVSSEKIAAVHTENS